MRVDWSEGSVPVHPYPYPTGQILRLESNRSIQKGFFFFFLDRNDRLSGVLNDTIST